jgi:DNA ligase (NAD+)
MYKQSKDTFKQYLIQCSDAYYNDQPVMSDAAFDKLQSEYEKTHHEEFNYLGSIYHKHHQKATLPFYTPSLAKVKEASAIQKFTHKSTSNINYVLSEKLDGFSLVIDYTTDGTFLYTRGSGSIGADVTHLLHFLSFPTIDVVLQTFASKMNKTDTRITIRGELVLPKSFQGNNLRNAISGVVNAKHPRLEICKAVHFVAHGVQSLNLCPSETFKLCHQAGFMVPMHQVVKTCTHKVCDDTLSLFLDKSKYPMDGLVVARDVPMPIMKNVSDNEGQTPSDVVAFKRSGETKTTTVIQIHWDQSRYGSLHPRVEIDPIDIDGCKINFCSGFHAKYIEENQLGPGSIIEVQRSGGVIPDIVEIIQSTKAQMPSMAYTWNGVHIHASGESNEQAISRLVHSLKILEAEGCSEKTVEKLFHAGFTNEIQCWNATLDDIMEIDGFKAKSASNLINALKQSKKNLTLVKLLQCTALFPGMKNKLESICASMDVAVYLKQKTAYSLAQVEAVCHKLSIYKAVETFVDGCEKFRESPVFMEMLDILQQMQQVQQSSSTLLSVAAPTAKGQLGKVCFTGFRDKDLKARAIAKGYDVVDSFSKQCVYLVCEDTSSSSTKITQAEKAGVKIISKDSFAQLC